MNLFSRADDSLAARWWWTVDRWMLLVLALLMAAGLILAFGASTPKAEDLGLPAFYFVKRQAIFALLAVTVITAVSLMETRSVRRLGLALFAAALALTAATLAIGIEYNGAQRWLSLGGFALQPSEFLKPGFIVVCAWLLSGAMQDEGFPGRRLTAVLWAVAVALLAAQPDVGQALLITAIWGLQLVLSGTSAVWIGALVGAGLLGLVAAYMAFPYVAERIDSFFAIDGSEASYQVETALNAFRAGGFFGRGPGEGSVKKVLPDAHTDYVFAVAGEEFGTLACLIVLALFAAIVLRGMARLAEESDPFSLLAAVGLIGLFGLQALVNMAVNLALLPPKGMTLPFISYGGSSMLALALAMGMVLALTRRNRFEARDLQAPGRWP